jgi:predicted outer membrane protein
MMVPKKSLVLSGAALLALCAAPAAQQSGAKGDGPMYRRATKPMQTVSIDMETGTITRGPKVQDKALSTCSSLFNNDFS